MTFAGSRGQRVTFQVESSNVAREPRFPYNFLYFDVVNVKSGKSVATARFRLTDVAELTGTTVTLPMAARYRLVIRVDQIFEGDLTVWMKTSR